MFKRRFLGRTHVPHNKNTKDKEAIRFCPESILLSTVQHIGAPATVKLNAHILNMEMKGVLKLLAYDKKYRFSIKVE